MKRTKGILFYASASLLCVAFFLFLLFYGPVYIPCGDVLTILGGGEPENDYWKTIVLDSRLPTALASICCGASLSVAGLILQTTFMNPLAGPSILGVSSGASLGVALLMLGGFSISTSIASGMISIFGALIGAFAVIMILIAFSGLLKNNVMLLIVGIMVSYLSSALISLLNFFSPAEGIRSYLIWGLGSFSGLQLGESVWLTCLCGTVCLLSLLFAKPLNALLLGERYASSIGYSVNSIRIWFLILTGLLVALPTAFCGPIGFIGLVVPHFARLFLKTSNHYHLLPASLLLGMAVALFCAAISVIPASRFGVLPINVITPLVGIPVIIYILLRRNKLAYFK